MPTFEKTRCLPLTIAGLLAAFVATCGGADICVQAKCSSGAALEIPLAALPASGTTVKVCRNVECYSAPLPTLPGAEEASAGLPFTGTTLLVGTLWREANHSVGLDLEWRFGSAEAAVDGDHYVVTLTDPAGTETIVLDRTAAYAPLEPSPEECSPTPTCRIARLEP